MTPVVEELLIEARSAWNLPKQITVSEWADAYRVLPGSSAEPGRWRTSRTPYLKGPMDTFNDPNVREITLMMSTQVGKTECMLNMVGYVAHEDPGPAAWLGAKEQDVKDFCVERIQPIFNLSEELITKLSKNKDEINKKDAVKSEKIEIITNAAVKEIKGGVMVNSLVYQDNISKENKTLEVQGIFIEIGNQPATSLAKGLVDFTKRDEIQVESEVFQTKTPGLFAAGDNNSGPYKQIVTAAGEGCKTALAAYDYLRKLNQK